MKRKVQEDELTLRLCLNGKAPHGQKERNVEQNFQQQAQEAIHTKRLVLHNETKHFDYWPISNRVLDLSKLHMCTTLIVQNSFFKIIPPKGLKVLEYIGDQNEILPKVILPLLTCLAVTSDGCIVPEVEFLSSHYPKLEVLEFHCSEGFFFADLVNDVEEMDVRKLPNLQTISVIYNKKIFSRRLDLQVSKDHEFALALAQEDEEKQENSPSSASYTWQKNGEQSCPICLEQFKKNDKVTTLGCFHIFHEVELKTWLEKKNSCPVCKLEVK